AGRVTVMRRGEVVTELATAGATAAELARAMVGRDVVLIASRGAPPPADAPVRLAVESLSVDRADGSRALDDVSLEVHGGEIVGVAGVEGNGQTELALAIAGLASSRG